MTIFRLVQKRSISEKVTRMKLISDEEFNMLLTLSGMGGKARYGKFYKASGGRKIPKQTFQNRLNALVQKRLMHHRKINQGALGESWYTLTPQARKLLANMSPNFWRPFLEGLRKTMENKEIEDKDKPKLLEQNLNELFKVAFETARKLTVMAGLEVDAARREALTLYVTEHVLGDFVRDVVSLLNQYQRFTSEKLKKTAQPVDVYKVRADG